MPIAIDTVVSHWHMTGSVMLQIRPLRILLEVNSCTRKLLDVLSAIRLVAFRPIISQRMCIIRHLHTIDKMLDRCCYY